MAIARAASAAGSLNEVFIGGGIPTRINTLIHGGLRSDLPPDKVRRRGTKAELARAFVSRVPGLSAAGSRTMYAAKMAFDRTVARELGDSEVVVGIFGSCALTLQAARAAHALPVLNFVNSHPADHNRILSELGGVRSSSHEMVPAAVARRVERELAEADLVLVPSRFVRDQLIARGNAPQHVALIPYGVELGAFTPRRSAREGRRVRCLFVGQLSHRKGIPLLARSARALGDIDFVLSGPVVSPEVLHDLPDNVRRMGTLTRTGVAMAMREADIFVLPSIEDSFGLVVLEAMAAGLPVVVTDHVGASEIIEPGVTGYVVPAGDEPALSSALRRLADDPDSRLRVGRAARERVEAESSWETYGAKALAAMADAMGAR
jgi:glycosyltransferase involved in cell wall biosynthesis